MDDLVTGPNDKIDAEPAELTPLLITVLTKALARSLAADRNPSRLAAIETELQEKISELVAAAKALSVTTITVVVTKPNGTRVSRDWLVDRLARERRLQ